MIKNDLFFLIDTQDAVYGNEAYDFASLIDDVRVKVSLKNSITVIYRLLLMVLAFWILLRSDQGMRRKVRFVKFIRIYSVVKA